MPKGSKTEVTDPNKQYDFAKLERLYYQTPRLSIRIIANTLGIHPQIITRLIAVGKLSHRTGVAYQASDETVEKLKRIGVMRLNDNKTWQEIADEFGVTNGAIRSMVKLHLPELMEQRRYPRYVDALIELYNKEEFNTRQIAMMLNIDSSAVDRVVRDLIDDGVIDEDKRVAFVHSFSRKQQEKLLRIDTLRKDGVTWRDIANEFGVKFPALHLFYRTHKHRLEKG